MDDETIDKYTKMIEAYHKAMEASSARLVANVQAAEEQRKRRRQMDKTTDQIKAIGDRYRQRVGTARLRLDAVTGDEARKYPPGYIESERREALAEMSRIEDDARVELLVMSREISQYADWEYASDPFDTSQRTAELMEADQLHRRYPSKLEAVNYLIGFVGLVQGHSRRRQPCPPEARSPMRQRIGSTGCPRS